MMAREMRTRIIRPDLLFVALQMSQSMMTKICPFPDLASLHQDPLLVTFKRIEFLFLGFLSARRSG